MIAMYLQFYIFEWFIDLCILHKKSMIIIDLINLVYW